MTRFYLSSAGYIVDRQNDTHVARIKDREGWRLRGERMCATLELNPEDMATFLELWANDLESANEKAHLPPGSGGGAQKEQSK